MKPEDFIAEYEQALAAQDWNAVAPLIHHDVCVTFSDGSVHKGIADVQRAFKRNFALIRDEKYAIDNVCWVRKESRIAVFLFDFAWEGFVNGKPAYGSGVGTSLLVNEEGRWKLLVEHLGNRVVADVA